MRRDLPSGTVTFLFTDVEGSTRLLHELGPRGYAGALAEHRRLLREAFTSRGGVEVDNQGDAFFFAFPTAEGACEAARTGVEALSPTPIRVRIGIHTGTPHLTTEGYVGSDVNKGARIAASGHGGQVLISKETRDLVDLEVTDLGEHRVKDFDSPVWIYQLGSDSFPPLKTISNTNLPRPASSLVGRQREIKDVVARLQDGVRLVTLTGTGGTGKTRLAIEAAAELVPEHRNGVFWVGLAPLRDPSLVTEEIARTLGAKDGLGEHISDKQMLLLLDNFEQVVDAAPELSKLLESCPNLKLMVTSRELLRIAGEIEFPVPPLAETEAVELFCARSALEPDDTIGELCRRLDNLPLAVELAAARTKVLSPHQILERLTKRLDLLKGGRDADPRQMTLRTTIEWSYDLLTDDEKTLFARLAVFRGGCTLEAAEEVCAAQLDVLQSLVDKSLVRHTNERFWMLETIRDFALERLDDSGDGDEIRRRHAEHFLTLAEDAEPYLFGRAGPADWLERLEREHDNLRVALDWLESSGETQLVLRLAGAVGDFWGIRGHLSEGRRRLDSALAADGGRTAARAKALNAAADLAAGAGDMSAVIASAEEALALHRDLGDSWGAANSLALLGYGFAEAGDMARAQRFVHDALRLFRELGDDDRAVAVSRTLAWIYEEIGEFDRSLALHEENLARARALGFKQIEARSLASFAMVLAEQGRALGDADSDRVERALSRLYQAYEIDRDHGDLFEIGLDLARFASALALGRRARTAAALLACSQRLLEQFGANVAWAARMNERAEIDIRNELDEAAFAEACEDGRALTADEAVALALGSRE